jgi:hypothetical protein
MTRPGDERLKARLSNTAEPDTKMPGTEIFPTVPGPSTGSGVPRRDGKLQAENEELKGQLAQLQEMLATRASGLAVQDGGLVIYDFQFTPTGLVAPEGMTKESWEQIGFLLFKLEGSIQWLIGDWLVYGADLSYGDIKQIAEAMGRDEQTFYNLMTTCRAVESYRRRELVSFAHHSEVTKMTPEFQSWALEFAERVRFNVKQFRKWIKLGMPETGLPEEQTALPEKAGPRYNVTKLAESGHHIATQDLNKIPPREIQSGIDSLVKAIELHQEAIDRMREALTRRGKK